MPTAIHLGHLLEYIQTDIWTAVYQKLRGHTCYYVCADDAHAPIMLAAELEGIYPSI